MRFWPAFLVLGATASVAVAAELRPLPVYFQQSWEVVKAQPLSPLVTRGSVGLARPTPPVQGAVSAFAPVTPHPAPMPAVTPGETQPMGAPSVASAQPDAADAVPAGDESKPAEAASTDQALPESVDTPDGAPAPKAERAPRKKKERYRDRAAREEVQTRREATVVQDGPGGSRTLVIPAAPMPGQQPAAAPAPAQRPAQPERVASVLQPTAQQAAPQASASGAFALKVPNNVRIRDKSSFVVGNTTYKLANTDGLGLDKSCKVERNGRCMWRPMRSLKQAIASATLTCKPVGGSSGAPVVQCSK